MLITTLESQEIIIQKGLDTFYTVGKALLAIRNQKLYKPDYPNFETYCKTKWGISRSQGYLLIDAGDVANTVTGVLPPHITHVAPLKRIQDPILRQKALDDLTDLPVVNGRIVHEIVQKYQIIAEDSVLGSKLLAQTITPQKAITLSDKLKVLPPYYRDAVVTYGLQGDSVSSATLSAIRNLEYDFKSEAIDILRSGYLDDTPLYDLHASQVDRHCRRLHWETSQARVLTIADKQRGGFTKFTVADGQEIFDVNSQGMVYAFPAGISLATLAKTFDDKGLTPLCVMAYTPNTKINFDGQPTLASNLNGIKPQVMTNFMEALCV